MVRFPVPDKMEQIYFSILPAKYSWNPEALYIKQNKKKTLKGKEKKADQLRISGAKDWESGEYSGFSFRLIYSGLAAGKASYLETSVDTYQKAPRKVCSP